MSKNNSLEYFSFSSISRKLKRLENHSNMNLEKLIDPNDTFLRKETNHLVFKIGEIFAKRIMIFKYLNFLFKSHFVTKDHFTFI